MLKRYITHHPAPQHAHSQPTQPHFMPLPSTSGKSTCAPYKSNVSKKGKTPSSGNENQKITISSIVHIHYRHNCTRKHITVGAFQHARGETVAKQLPSSRLAGACERAAEGTRNKRSERRARAGRARLRGYLLSQMASGETGGKGGSEGRTEEKEDSSQDDVWLEQEGPLSFQSERRESHVTDRSVVSAAGPVCAASGADVGTSVPRSIKLGRMLMTPRMKRAGTNGGTRGAEGKEAAQIADLSPMSVMSGGGSAATFSRRAADRRGWRGKIRRAFGMRSHSPAVSPADMHHN